MEKLKFEFTIKAAVDEKTNYIAVTSITTVGEQKYAIPEEFQPINFHTELMKTSAFKKIKTTLKRRNNTRSVWITLTDGLSEAYKDEDQNLQFKDNYLEEITSSTISGTNYDTTEKVMTKLLESLTEKKTENKQNNAGRNLKKLSDKFVLEKFSGKSSNVIQWINLYENECNRLGIENDEEKIETLRLFLESSCLDWYSSMLIKFSLNSEWANWKSNFCETYADKGWTPVKYALQFKYINGPLLDYALKKERILLEMNKEINQEILVYLIAAALPDFITDRINRNEIKNTGDLFNELRSLEHIIKRKPTEKKELNKNSKDKLPEKKPCRICEKLGKRNRYHLESTCWFKNKEKEEDERRNNIKSVNNSEIEAELNDIDEKNF